VNDVFSLQLAIYFILPPVALYVSAYLCAGVLILFAQLVVEREVSHDRAMHAMAFVIAATTGVAAFVYWTTQILWVTIAAGSSSFFFVGAVIYSRFIEDFSPGGERGATAPIGLSRGTQISAMISLCAVAFTLFVLWGAGGVR